MSNYKESCPYFISSVLIEGLFSRYDFYWEFSDVNVLVGKNGSGKSTILKLIDFCVNTPETEMDRREVNSIAGKFKRIEVTLNNGCKFNVELEEGGKAKKEFEGFLRELAKSDDFKRSLKEKYGDQFNVDSILAGLASEPNPEEGNYLFSGQKTLIKSGDGVDGAKESIRDYICFERISTFDMLLLSKKEYDEHGENYYSQLDFLLKKEMDKLKELLILKNSDVSERLSKNSKLKKYGSVKKAEFKEVKNFIDVVNSLFSSEGKRFDIKRNGDLEILMEKEEVRYEDLSSGEKQMLVILLKAVNSTTKPAIILCDEPELSLHLSWQEKLIDSIRKVNPMCQLVIVSHSPAIVMKGWISSMAEISSLKREVRQDA